MTPREYAKKRVQVTGLYSRDSESLEVILAQKPKIWLEMRKNAKTDSETNKLWEASEMGVEETLLKLRMKRYEKQLSSLKTMLDVLSQEARNII